MNSIFINLIKSLFIFVPLIAIFAQSPTIAKIDLIGYEKTKPYVIEREIQHSIGVTLDSSLAEADRARLENLGIFSFVAWDAFPVSEDEVTLRFTIIESWRFFPSFSPIYHEKWGWSFGAALLMKNIRGHNESITIRGQYGGQDAFGIQFTNPWITGDHISFSLSLGRDLYSHTYLPYDVTSDHFQIGVGRYFGESIKTQAGFTISDRSYINEAITEEYRHFTPFVKINYDTRDIYNAPNKGIHNTNTIFTKIDIGGNRNSLFAWDQSLSYFHELIHHDRNLVAGLNISSYLSFGKKLEVWQSYLGSAYSVRGWTVPSRQLYQDGDQSYRFGMNSIHTSAELRQTVIPKFTTKFNNEVGLSIVAFADAGLISDDKMKLFNQKPILGIGLGLHMPWPVVGTIRLDYGWSFYDGKYIEQSFHLAFGEKF